MSKTTIELEVVGEFGARAFLSQRFLKAGLMPKRFTQNIEGECNVITIEAVGDAKISMHALANLLADHRSVVCVRKVSNGDFTFIDKRCFSFEGKNSEAEADNTDIAQEVTLYRSKITEDKTDIASRSSSGVVRYAGQCGDKEKSVFGALSARIKKLPGFA